MKPPWWAITKYLTWCLGDDATREQRLLWSAGILHVARTPGETREVWEPFMQQRWLIADHWSAYHDMVATSEGWSLSYINGMWQVVTLDPAKFKTDEAAHKHVLMNEHDTLNRIYAQAIEAVVVGNFKGVGGDGV